jgi:hypothetical protein
MNAEAGDPTRGPHFPSDSEDVSPARDPSPERTLPQWLRDESTRRIARALVLGVALGTFLVRAARR